MQWLALAGLRLSSGVKLVLGLTMAIFTAAGLAREARGGRGFEAVSQRLAVPSRRSVLALWLASSGVAILGDVRWRSLQRMRSAKDVPGTGAGDPPSFILVTFDALSAEDMSLHGYHLPTTPNIDRLAARSIVFDRYYAASGFTTSAVTSIFTGMSVPRHGWYQALDGRLPDKSRSKSLAAILKAHGYTTGAIVGNVAAHPMHIGLEDGFDVLPSPPLPKIWGSDFGYHLTHCGIGRAVEEAVNSRLQYWARFTGIAAPMVTAYPPELAFAQAKAFLDKVKGPYFLWVHVVPPHFPYDAPPPFSGRFLQGPEYRHSRLYESSPLAPLLPNLGTYDPALQPEIDKVRLRYDEYVAYADHAFGDFLKGVEAMGGMANTATIVSADHGENFSNGFWGHGETKMWNGSMHIPLVLHLPGGKARGLRVPGVAGEIDLLPTVLDLAGIDVPPWAEGHSLRPMWEGAETAGRTRAAVGVLGGLQQPVTKGVVAVISADDKYILDIESGQGNLYDLASDPGERRDLSPSRPAKAQALRALAFDVISGGGRHG